jgi:hypothetical protein
MTFTKHYILSATLVLTMVAGGRAIAQAAPPATQEPSQVLPNLPPRVAPSPSPEPLFNFKDSDIKFDLNHLMNVLRDSRHEGWVLAAYPDPKTSRPLIGAGFGLDVPASEHPQLDPLNPHPFIEPSTAQLWQAAGLDSVRLQSVLDQFDRELTAWKKKNFRRKIRTHALAPQLSEADATKLLRISAIQATYNARAYCRMFDQLTASQQMALSQLVFQMGVNLEEFAQFRSALNGGANGDDSLQLVSASDAAAEHWKNVQTTLIQSQWARRYSTRAISVIAMFDPNYDMDPRAAERKVQATLHPPASHHRKKTHAASARAGNHGSHSDSLPSKKTAKTT